MAGEGEVIIATILVVPVRCRTGGIGPYQRMQSTCSHLLPFSVAEPEPSEPGFFGLAGAGAGARTFWSGSGSGSDLMGF